MPLIHRLEKPLFVISLVIGSIAWLAALWFTKGLLLIYVPIVLLIYVFAHSAFISHLKGNAVELSDDQLPDLFVQYRESCSILDLPAIPRAYLMMSDGVVNALATKFLRRKYVVVFSSVIDALRSRPEALRFYFGHELAHIKRGHLNLRWLLFPASVLPLLGAAYRRAQEYTCDLHGLAASKSRDDAVAALGVLASGGEKLPALNSARFVAQNSESGGFWMSFHELTNDYPWLTKRIDQIASDTPSSPRRSFFAWVLACFVPRVGMAGGGAAGTLVIVAVIGILAAIAIPAYQDYTLRAQVAQAMPAMRQVQQAAQEYVEREGVYPASPEDIGLASTSETGPISAVSISEDGISLVLRSRHLQLHGQSILLEANRSKDGSISWNCSGGSLPQKYRPPQCRAGP